MADDVKDVRPPTLEERVLYLEKLVHTVAGLSPLDSVVAADAKAAAEKAEADAKAAGPVKPKPELGADLKPVSGDVKPSDAKAKTLGPQS